VGSIPAVSADLAARSEGCRSPPLPPGARGLRGRRAAPAPRRRRGV